jgi:hypothetical protein
MWFGPIVTLCTPQTNFYDLGLAIVPLALRFRCTRIVHWAFFSVLVTASALAASERGAIGVPWFLAISLLIFAAAAKAGIGAERATDGPVS